MPPPPAPASLRENAEVIARASLEFKDHFPKNFAARFAQMEKRDKLERLRAVSQSSLAPTPIACDNQAVVAASGNPETSQRTRHLDMRYFKVRDYIRQQQLRVRHIRTDVIVNVADFFTKQLPKKDYQRYRDYLGMEDHSV